MGFSVILFFHIESKSFLVERSIFGFIVLSFLFNTFILVYLISFL